ncbi:hypothetical protein BDZ91DRAFT_742144, partial [Kalaharituber pfeilii]
MGLNPSVGAFLGTNFGMGGRSPRTNRDFGRELAGSLLPAICASRSQHLSASSSSLMSSSLHG